MVRPRRRDGPEFEAASTLVRIRSSTELPVSWPGRKSPSAREGDVRVRIIADPQIKVNRHEILAEGDFGQISTKVENVPFPKNPRTSYLAALSAIATLRSIVEPIKIGT